MIKRNVRITAIPRLTSPGAGFHPMYFAKKYNDRVLAIPGDGGALEAEYQSLTDKIFNWLPLRLQKIVFTIEVILTVLIEKCDHVYVHSFWFSLPLVLFNRSTSVIIHGSDYQYLVKPIGRFVSKFAYRIYVVGKRDFCQEHGFKSIPNLFEVDSNSLPNSKANRDIDYLFVLREAPVKNPSFPKRLYDSTRQNNLDIKIVVIGLDSENILDGNSSLKYFETIHRNDIYSFFIKSKVFVLPSFKEGIPKALLEALSNGCICICHEDLVLPSEIEPFLIRTNCTQDSEIDYKLFQKTLNSECELAQLVAIDSYRKSSLAELDKIYKLKD